MSEKDSTSRRRPRVEAKSVTAQPGSVLVEKGGTFNLGDYNSYKLSIGVNLPINYTEVDVINARKSVRKAAEIVQEELDNILNIDGIVKE